MKSIAILGRQPAFGLAELESLLGAEKVQPFGLQVALLDIDNVDIPFNRLGSVVRLAKILTPLEAINWLDIEKHLVSVAAEHASLVEGKLSFGLSVFGFPATKEQVTKTGLAMKKVIKNSGKSVRVVPNINLELNSASVFHNKLIGPNGWELLIVSDGKKTYLAQTTNIQDFEAYAARDQARPARDPRVGMLPPKLAQTLVNLAVTNTNPHHGAVVLDPFCGTGVVLQEASLMEFDVYGSDLEPRMIEYSETNLQWMLDNLIRKPASKYWKLEQGDATTHTWQPTPNFIVSETYLGPPLTHLPEPQKMSQLAHDISRLHNKFLENIAKQIKPGTRVCLAVPAWKTRNGFLHLSTLEKLKDLGYTRVEFKHVRPDQLIYHRENQIVARELVVLTKD